MFKLKKNFILGFLLLAALSLISISVGGEFLHRRIHHHTNQVSHDECFIYQLQVQVFLFLAFFRLALLLQVHSYIVRIYQVFLFKFCHLIPPLRAPPVFQI